VFEGARKKDEDWNPEEEGGYAVHDTEAPSAADAPVDPFAHIEKTIDQQTWAKTKTSRLTELQESADRLSSDPYVVSSALRRRFREEKKILLEKQARDDGVKAKFGLADDVDLGDEDVELARERWEAGRERMGLPVDEPLSAEMSVRAIVGTPTARTGTTRTEGQDLGKALRRTTARKYDPFGDAMDELFASGSKVRLKGKVKDSGVVESIATGVKAKEQASVPATPMMAGLGGGLLAGYESD
jgi:coiled-coil domain-containing protein 130